SSTFEGLNCNRVLSLSVPFSTASLNIFQKLSGSERGRRRNLREGRLNFGGINKCEKVDLGGPCAWVLTPWGVRKLQNVVKLSYVEINHRSFLRQTNRK
ncbi:hypothetical protein CFP56_034059, partial [Quercus suber]